MRGIQLDRDWVTLSDALDPNLSLSDALDPNLSLSDALDHNFANQVIGVGLEAVT
jgi:hypothetical protein